VPARRWYDLGGIELAAARALLAGEDPPETPEKGVNHFKVGFGGQVTIFPSAYDSSAIPLLAPFVTSLAPHLQRLEPLAMRFLGRRR